MSFGKRLFALLFLLGGVTALSNASPALASGGTGCSTYSVKVGDTAASVAKHFGTTTAQLAHDNRAVAIAGTRMLAPMSTIKVCHPTGPGSVGDLKGQPCQSTQYWPSNGISTDALPPGCYAGDYHISASNYPHISATFGGCDWWPGAMHPTWDIWTLPKHSTPKVGAAIWFAPGEQGAASEGHWGVVVAISSDGRYILSSEMNTTYYNRTGHGGTQGGYGHVIYRYIRNDAPRTLYVYP